MILNDKQHGEVEHAMGRPMSRDPKDWDLAQTIMSYWVITKPMQPWQLKDDGYITPATSDVGGTWDLWETETPTFYASVRAHNEAEWREKQP